MPRKKLDKSKGVTSAQISAPQGLGVQRSTVSTPIVLMLVNQRINCACPACAEMSELLQLFTRSGKQARYQHDFVRARDENSVQKHGKVHVVR